VSRVLRGGAWYHYPWNCRAADRNDNAPDDRLNFIGFRVCRGAPIEPLRAAPLDTGPLAALITGRRGRGAGDFFFAAVIVDSRQRHVAGRA
jgi:hypothetical protein